MVTPSSGRTDLSLVLAQIILTILTVSDGNECALQPVSGILAQLDGRRTTSQGTTRRMSHREAHPGTDDLDMLSRRSSFPNGARWWSMASTAAASVSVSGEGQWGTCCADTHESINGWCTNCEDVSACVMEAWRGTYVCTETTTNP